MCFHNYIYGIDLLVFGLYILILLAWEWWSQVIVEGSQGSHTLKVQAGLKLGMSLFILSEIMFFFGFFWSFFHLSLSPSVETGCLWPPLGIKVLHPLYLPLVNTFILLESGFMVNIACCSLYMGSLKHAIRGFSVTLILACLFTFFQFLEYKNASFNLSDGAYGTTFFMITGLHGLHVIIGTIFLFICSMRIYWTYNQPKNIYAFKKDGFVGMICATWYWHFVDIVWLFVYSYVYLWGSGILV